MIFKTAENGCEIVLRTEPSESGAPRLTLEVDGVHIAGYKLTPPKAKTRTPIGTASTPMGASGPLPDENWCNCADSGDVCHDQEQKDYEGRCRFT
jgi:hypothetical protein